MRGVRKILRPQLFFLEGEKELAATSDTKLIDLSGLKTAIDLIFAAVSEQTAKNINAVEATSSNTIVFKCVDGSTAYTLTNSTYTHPTYTARTGLPTGNQTPAFGGTFQVSQITSDSTGHVTGANARTITIPSLPTASSSTLGCVKVGTGLTINSGTLNVSLSELILPSSSSSSDRAIWIS